ncbi:MAG TPA: hypothetical protein DCE71_08745 [Parachlamydiales bacterium]|nr:hypothetical protein [Parachlamydiales bacterium]
MSFVSELIPSRAWVHAYIEQPFEEGIERIKRAVHGKYLHLFEQDKYPISLRDRCIYFLSGSLLLIPLINVIISSFMKTFFEPEQLAQPYMLAKGDQRNVEEGESTTEIL